MGWTVMWLLPQQAGNPICAGLATFSRQAVKCEHPPAPRPYTEWEKCRSSISWRAAYDRLAACTTEEQLI